MKRLFAVLLLLVVFLLPLVGCTPVSDGKTRIVVTVYPLYDWVMQVLGDRASAFSVTLLLEGGADMHSYELTVAARAAIERADLLVYIGGESEEWLEEILSDGTQREMRTMPLLERMGERALLEESVGAEEPSGHEEGEEEYDEHIWLSLKNAAYCVDLIASEIAEADGAFASRYAANAAAYVQSLNELDARYEQTVLESPRKELFFADRFPFRYLTEDYSLTYYAAFSGCSVEVDASIANQKYLIDTIDAHHFKTLLILERSSDDLAKSLIRYTETEDQMILVLDSLQSAPKEERRDYLSVMESNLSVLRQALSA